MKHRLRRLAAGIALTAAAATGFTLTDGTIVQPADTTWGSPDTSDTTWTEPATDDGSDGTVITPQDTTWG